MVNHSVQVCHAASIQERGLCRCPPRGSKRPVGKTGGYVPSGWRLSALTPHPPPPRPARAFVSCGVVAALPVSRMSIWIDDQDSRMSYTGTWTHVFNSLGDSLSYGKANGSTMSFSFGPQSGDDPAHRSTLCSLYDPIIKSDHLHSFTSYSSNRYVRRS